VDRPSLRPAIAAILDDLGRALPDALGPVDTSRILIVAAAARRDARATIRPLAPRIEWVTPTVTIDGRPALYELALRPRWFLATEADARVVTLAHELWHAGPRFDGTLPASRGHRATPGGEVEGAVTRLVEEWRSRSRRAAELTAALALPGEYRLTSWLIRPPTRIPPNSRIRRAYDERDLYEAIVELTSSRA